MAAAVASSVEAAVVVEEAVKMEVEAVVAAAEVEAATAVAETEEGVEARFGVKPVSELEDL